MNLNLTCPDLKKSSHAPSASSTADGTQAIGAAERREGPNLVQGWLEYEQRRWNHARALFLTEARSTLDSVDAAVADFQKKHAGLRSYEDHEVPAYCEDMQWMPRPVGVNNFAGHQPLPKRCLEKELGKEDLKYRGPNGSPSGECFQLDRRMQNQSQPVLPTIFMPGFPKSASTWLFECMHVAFIPEMVCGDSPARAAVAAAGTITAEQARITAALAAPAATRFGLNAEAPRARRQPKPVSRPFDPRNWSKKGCEGRRYMLPGISCAVTGGCMHRKELFFYGGGYGNYFKVGLAALHGPEIPLELFARAEHRPPRMKTRDWDYYKVKRFEPFCTNPAHTHLPAGRIHPACCMARASWPKRWGCRWHETLRMRFGRATSIWLQSAMPWVKPDEYEFASVDFTPNYLCHVGALHNINATARDPSELRFIVLMRDPLMRAYSEFSMFTTWGWDKGTSFSTRTAEQMGRFRQCNTTLFHRPDLLRTLPDEELFAYMQQCFKGLAME